MMTRRKNNIEWDIPSEAEIRRMFQESYYVTDKYNPETGHTISVQNEWHRLIYPKEVEHGS
jgi:hypothetical protein